MESDNALSVKNEGGKYEYDRQGNHLSTDTQSNTQKYFRSKVDMGDLMLRQLVDLQERGSSKA